MNRIERCEKLEKISLKDLGNFELELRKEESSLKISKDNNHFAWVFPSENQKWNNEMYLDPLSDYDLGNKIKKRYEKILDEKIELMYAPLK